MRGLDPRIHAEARTRKHRCSMDCRVKPGNDALRTRDQYDAMAV
jgi:hypothetical protein